MSQSSTRASKFYSDVVKNQRLWTIKDQSGFPAPLNSDGSRVAPFWSDTALADQLIRTVPAYSGFTLHEITWGDFINKWIPGLTRDGLLVGLNWSGEKAIGFDLKPEEVLRNVHELMVKAATESMDKMR